MFETTVVKRLTLGSPVCANRVMFTPRVRVRGGGGYRETEENAHLLKEQLNSMTRKAERVELLTSQLGKLQVHNEVSKYAFGTCGSQ